MNEASRLKYLEDADQDSALYVQRWLCCKGACFLTGGVPVAINVTLLPTPVATAAYDHLVKSQVPLNSLIDLCSRDREWVISTTTPSVDVDYGAKKLLEIYKACAGDPDQITLGMYRHDYMFNTSGPGAGHFKQVEFNLMSAALLGIGSYVFMLHAQTLAQHWPQHSQPSKDSLPPMMRGVAAAFEAYNRPGSIFCMIVGGTDFNWFDQQKIIDVLLEEYNIDSVRVTYADLMKEGSIRDRRYYLRGREVGMFYFRQMYNEEHYETEEHWTHRMDMEKCLTVKVPNIRHQLLNLKLFQLALLKPGVVERYLGPEDATLVRSTFAEFYNLSPGPEGDKAAQLAYSAPNDWVMKPSKEGGGNNIWEEEMCSKLRELEGKDERGSFVLMQRLKPPSYKNRMVKQTNAGSVMTPIMDTTAEVGMFCVYVENKGQVIMNEVGGPLVRTKPAANNEGGIAIGVGVMDSAVFVD